MGTLGLNAMEHALLYTFSTIAQALGGAFALLSAFMLYRLQSCKAASNGYLAFVTRRF